MSRRKIPTKVKEPIHVRTKKLANGNQSIYLDRYWQGKRSYEFLKGYFLIPETDNASKLLNAQTMQAVNAIKAQRITALMDGTAGLKAKEDKYLLLKDWMEWYSNEKKKLGQSERNYKSIICCARQIEHWIGESAYKSKKLVDVDTEFCENFILYLQSAPCNLGVTFKNKEGKSVQKKHKVLAKSTQSLYYRQFAAAMNMAAKKHKMKESPCKDVDASYKKLIKPDDPKVAYLDIDEVKRLEATPMKQEQVKHAFLFSCYCGLRLSDVEALQWKNIKKDTISVHMKKTDEDIDIPLSERAKSFLPKRNGKKDSDLVFHLPCRTCIARDLERWGKRANLSKHLTFHVSRHSFGTGIISAGGDLYTASVLMGHHSLKVTKGYAEVVAEKKRHAIDLLDKM